MRIIGVVAFIVVFSVTLAAQGVLKGKISSKQEESLPFSNITITLSDGKVLGTSADVTGKYSLKLNPGIYTVKASYIGHIHQTEKIEIKEGVVTALNFILVENVAIIGCPVVYDTRPFTVQKIYEKDIEKQNLGQDVPFLLKMTPSAVVTSDAGAGIGYTAIRVRGSDQTNINVTVNGIPLNDSESHQVFWVDLPDIMASANNIEIERGVGTSKNGAGAFGATINVSTKMASPKPSLVLASTVGSFNTQKYSLEAGTGNLLDDEIEGTSLAFTGRVSRIKSAGYIDRSASSLSSYFLSANYLKNAASLKLNLFSGHEITYQSWYGVPLNYIEIDSLRTYNEAGQERTDKPHPDQVDNYKQTHYQAIYENRINNIKINAALHYTKGAGYYEQYKAGQNVFNYGSDSLIINGTLVEESDLIRRKWLDNDFYGGIFSLTIPVLDGITIGGGWNKYVGQHFGKVIWAQYAGIPQGKEYYRNEANKQDFNIYAKTEKKFDHFNTYLDLQYRKVRYAFIGFDEEGETLPETVNHHFFNPKVGVSYNINGHLAYASMAVARREPNRSDYRSNPISRKPKAERLIDWEVGLRKQTSKLRYAVNAFFMRYKDQLVLTGKLTEVGEYARVNVPKSYRLGLETDAAYQVSDLFGVAGNVSISKNKITAFTEHIDNWDTWAQETIVHKNTNLAFSPNVTAALALNFSFLEKKLNASLANKYVGKQFLDNTSNDLTALDAYLYNDLQLNYLLAKNKIEYLLNLKINNLFNRKYSANGWAYRYRTDNEYLGPYDQREGNGTYSQVGFYPQAGINFLLGLVVKF